MTCYPFKAAELENISNQKPLQMPYGQPPRSNIPKFHTPITPKENILRIYQKEKPLWVPQFMVDFNVLQPLVMPDANARNNGGIDWFGIEWEYEPLSRAAMVKPGTRRLSDITNWEKEIVWPDLNAIDWEADYKRNYADAIDPDRANAFIIVNGIFERLADLTNFSDAFCYLLEEEEALHAFYEKLTDWHIELIKIAREIYHADIITWHDDMGSQKSAFMSPDTYAEILLPHYKKITEAAHKMGMYVNLHSCGCVGIQIENFISAGFDSWEGQDNCNDKQAIMDQYGERLGQFGGFLVPAAAEGKEYLDIIRDRISGLAKTGRYICLTRDENPDRQPETEKLIYQLSREFYCGNEVASNEA